MKRIGVYLFLMVALLCMAYGFSFYMYENKQKELAQEEELKKSLEEDGKQTAQGEQTGVAGGNTDSATQVEKNPDKNDSETKETGANKTPSYWQYLMKYQNGKIIVYQKDGKTVYEETDIDQSHLSKDILEQLKQGIQVSDEEELYSLLESFSS